MAERKIVGWFTINGKHVPIYEGEDSKAAYNRTIAEMNEDKKNSDIAKNKAMADKLNGKTTEDEQAKQHGYTKQDERQDAIDDTAYDLEHEEGLSKADAAEAAREIVEGGDYDKVVAKYKTTRQKNAKALGLDYEKEGKALMSEFEAKKAEYEKTPSVQVEKRGELRRWLTSHQNAYHEYKHKLGGK